MLIFIVFFGLLILSGLGFGIWAVYNLANSRSIEEPLDPPIVSNISLLLISGLFIVTAVAIFSPQIMSSSDVFERFFWDLPQPTEQLQSSNYVLKTTGEHDLTDAIVAIVGLGIQILLLIGAFFAWLNFQQNRTDSEHHILSKFHSSELRHGRTYVRNFGGQNYDEEYPNSYFTEFCEKNKEILAKAKWQQNSTHVMGELQKFIGVRAFAFGHWPSILVNMKLDPSLGDLDIRKLERYSRDMAATQSIKEIFLSHGIWDKGQLDFWGTVRSKNRSFESACMVIGRHVTGNIEGALNEYNYVSKLILLKSIRISFLTELSRKNFLQFYDLTRVFIDIRRTAQPLYMDEFDLVVAKYRSAINDKAKKAAADAKKRKEMMS